MKPATLLSLALLTVGANANIFPTEPVAASTWSGGEKVKLLWKDDNVPPLISELNNLTIELMTGTDTNQTSLSVIGTNIKGIAGTADYTVPKDLGPPGKFYFVRFNQGKNFVWSTRFNIEKIASPVPKATDPQVTTPKAPDAPKTTDAPKAEAPKTTDTSKPAYNNPPKASASTSSPAAAAAATTTPTPQSASEAIGISPSSLMSIAIGGVAFIFTYMY